MTTSLSPGRGTSPSPSSIHPKTSLEGRNPFFSRPRRRLSRIKETRNDATRTVSKLDGHKEARRQSKKALQPEDF
jgi:hypothetical protein